MGILKVGIEVALYVIKSLTSKHESCAGGRAAEGEALLTACFKQYTLGKPYLGRE